MRTLISLLLLLTISVNAFSDDIIRTVYINDNTSEEWVGHHYAMYFEDSTSNMSLEEVVSKGIFRKDENHDPLNYNTKSAYWMRFLMIDKRKNELPLRLEFFDFNTDEITFYYLDKNQQFIGRKAGFNVAFNSREVNHKNVSFRVYPVYKDSSYCYVRFKSSRHNVLKPVIRSYDKVLNYGLNEYILLGVFLGLLVLMIFHNLLYYVLLRKNNYLYYVLYAFTVFLYLMSENGLGFQYLWPNHSEWNSSIDITMLFLSTLMMLLFTNSFLELQSKRKELYKWLKGAFVLRIVIFAFELFITSDLWVIVDVVFVQIMLTIGLITLQKGFKSSRWFVLAFACLDIAFLISFFEHVGVVGSNVFTVYSLYLGIIFQFIFLSISIAESVKEAYKERNEVQGQLILELEKNEQLSEKVNRELETKVAERTKALNEKRLIIEEKNNQIISSVRYAERIQTSTLPDDKLMNRVVPKHFVYYKPRDIVSGDFYWIHEWSDQRYIIAAIDCTGHGIPGAFMSMIGINLLDRIVSEGIIEPAEMLEELHVNIQNVLKQRETNNSDGMDMSVCLVDREEKRITYAGARNPLIYVQNGEVKRIKGTRKSIGGASEQDKLGFEQHRVSFKDAPITYYMLSDGYVDQFGGEKNEKFRMQNFLAFIDEHKELNHSGQKEALSKKMRDWISQVENNFQIDDILVIGVTEE